MAFASLFLCTLLVATPFAAAHTQVYTVGAGTLATTGGDGKDVVFASDYGMNLAACSPAALWKEMARIPLAQGR
jgi:hypothetical protein